MKRQVVRAQETKKEPDVPTQKLVHKAAKVSLSGAASALCFKRPRAIDLRCSTWTLIDADVTCKRCRELVERTAATREQT